jgi:type I restriction enzyme S subunit
MISYSSYKSSGIIWAGEIPSNWNISKIKFVANNEDGKREPISGEFRHDKKGDYPYYGATGIVDYINEFRFDGKYLLIGEDGAPFFIPNKNVAFIAEGKFWVNNHAHVLSCKDEIDLVYLCHLLNCVDYREYISGSTRDKLTKADLSDIRVLLPSFSEQTKIAQYLDHQTAIIDQLIQQKEKLIGLLKEKRQVLINEAVTKGLNPNVQMKDSRIDWLGEVPHTWNLVQIRHLNTKVGSGVTPKGGAEVYTEEGVIFIRSQNVHFDGLRLDDVVKIDYDTYEKMSGSKVQYKDVLLNITGASIGRCCVVDIYDEMNVNQHVCIIRPSQKILPEYLNLVLQSNIGQVQIKLGTTGGNREGLTFEAIKEFTIPLPSLAEQQEILGKVQSSLKQFCELDNLNTTQIEKLKEYRQSIISEAVTGKIDVREWQPNKIQVT